MAKDIYSTHTYLKAEALVQLDDTKEEGHMMTAARITHPGTGEQSVLRVAEVQTFADEKGFNENNSKIISEVKGKFTTAKAVVELQFLPVRPAEWFNSIGFSNMQANVYWSSTSYTNVANNAWVINMYDGSVYNDVKADGSYVWPVRSL